MGRLSLRDTVRRGGCRRRCLRAGSERGRPGLRRGGVSRWAPVAVETPGHWAPSLCLVSGVYTTYVLKEFRLPALRIFGKVKSRPLHEAFSAALFSGFMRPPRIP